MVREVWFGSKMWWVGQHCSFSRLGSQHPDPDCGPQSQAAHSFVLQPVPLASVPCPRDSPEGLAPLSFLGPLLLTRLPTRLHPRVPTWAHCVVHPAP